MDVLETLATGTLPAAFPFAFESPFDPTSPWSLVLAFYPETGRLPAVDFTNTTDGSSRATDGAADTLDEEVQAFIREECTRKGWIELPEGETPGSFFLKVRMRLSDDMARRLELPNDVAGADMTWIDGCVRVLQLWRKLGPGAGASVGADSTDFSLHEMEDRSETTSARMFAALASLEPSGWTMQQRLRYLLLPYARYAQRTDLLEQWGAQHSLEELRPALAVPELTAELLRQCLAAPIPQWQAVRQIVDHIPPSHLTGKQNDTISEPTKENVDFIIRLAEAAATGKLPMATFQQLADWARADTTTQEVVLHRALHAAPVSLTELTALRKGVLPSISEDVFVREAVRAAVRRSRFNFLSQLPRGAHHDTLRREVLALVADFEAHDPSATLPQVVGALVFAADNIDDSSKAEQDQEILALHTKYSNLCQTVAAFDIEPHYVLEHVRRDVTARILERDNGAYVRYTDLVTLVGSGNAEAAAEIAEQCVETALANNDFEAACEYFERGFVQESSPSAWLAYFLTGKYLSPQWDLPRPASVLRQQQKLLARALALCPADDLSSVLAAWSAADAEGVSETPSSEPEAEEIVVEEEKPRDLSSLFGRGLGWAIGANQ